MTQKFVTLPREVVEQAIDALYCTNSKEGSPTYNFELKAIKELRAALEQPQDHVPDAGNMVPDGWKPVPSDATHKWAENLADRGMRISGLASAISDMLAAAPQPPVVEQHTDDAAVNRFAEAMKAKLAVARDKGRGGWDDPAQCTVEYLAKLLVDHIAKGDPIDVANFAMMLHQRQADKSVLSAAAPTPTAVDHPEPAYLLRDLAYDICVDVPDLIVAIREAGLGNYSINMMLPARVCVAMCQKFSAAPQPQVEQEPVGEVGSMPGTIGFTMACFHASDAPVGTKLYTRPQNLRCKSTQARLATLWGYVKEQPKLEPLSTARIDELIEEGIFGGNPYELVRRLEEERGVFMTRPLTDEVIKDIHSAIKWHEFGSGLAFASAIEAAHNIK